MEIRVCKASGEHVTETTIAIRQSLDEVVKVGLVKSRFVFGRDADKIVEGLLASLPGGTIDEVLVRLMQHKMSSLMVAPRVPALAPIPPVEINLGGVVDLQERGYYMPQASALLGDGR